MLGIFEEYCGTGSRMVQVPMFAPGRHVSGPIWVYLGDFALSLMSLDTVSSRKRHAGACTDSLRPPSVVGRTSPLTRTARALLCCALAGVEAFKSSIQSVLGCFSCRFQGSNVMMNRIHQGELMLLAVLDSDSILFRLRKASLTLELSFPATRKV